MKCERAHWRARIGLAITTLIAACGGVDQTVLPPRVDYVCANNRALQVARSEDGRRAAIRVDGKDIVLQRAGSAAQEKYSDGRYSLYLEGERAMLEDENRIIFGPCPSAVPLPSAPRPRY